MTTEPFEDWEDKEDEENASDEESDTDDLLTGVSNADEVDWRYLGAVDPVYDQGKCGASWAFSSVTSVVGAHWVAANENIPLS